MQRINRDTLVAIILLVACGVFFWASFDIRNPDYGVLPPSTWPRFIIGLLSLLSLIYLIQSLKAGPDDVGPTTGMSFMARLAYWRNPLICFAMFFAFLLSLPILGMLIGGISFVFLLMSLLGGWAPKQMAVHATVAVVAVGSMWSLFTFGLGVILPPGVIYNPFG